MIFLKAVLTALLAVAMAWALLVCAITAIVAIRFLTHIHEINGFAISFGTDSPRLFWWFAALIFVLGFLIRFWQLSGRRKGASGESR